MVQPMNPTKNLIVISILVLSWLGGATVGASIASAQDVQITGPLAGQPPCRGCRIYRETRFQLEPVLAFTLQDEFSRAIMVGAQLNFHITDWFGIGGWGVYAPIHIDTGLTDQVTSRALTTDRNRLSLPDAGTFPEQIGQISWIAALQATFIPLRGKLALFQKAFIDTDFYIFAGVAFVGVEERADITPQTQVRSTACDIQMFNDAECRSSQTLRASRVAIAPTFGAGLMFYMNDFMGLSFEWRGVPFSWNSSGTDQQGEGAGGDFPDDTIDSEDQIFHFNHMVAIGLAFYFPTVAETGE